MSEPRDQKLEMRNIPGMRSRERFVEAEHAQNVGDTLKRIIAYFIHEKILVFGMLAVVIFGTCVVCTHQACRAMRLISSQEPVRDN